MIRLAALLLGLCAIAFTPADAQSAPEAYPNRPIRIVVPFAPGGSTDVVARALSAELGNELGQTIVVENKPGADGLVAIQELIRAGGDGYTLMIGNVASNAVVPLFRAGAMPFDYERDVVPVMRLVDVAGVLVATTKNFPPLSLSELLAYAREHPGKINYGTTGSGSNYVDYDVAVLAQRAGGLQMTAVPNKAGASGMINDLLDGDVQIAFVNAATSVGLVKAGSLRALAVANYARLADLPDVPTMKEAGFADVGTIAWQGLFASAAVPPSVLDKVRIAATRALASPQVKSVLEKQSFNIVPTKSLDEAKTWLAGEMRDWRKIMQDTKIATPK